MEKKKDELLELTPQEYFNTVKGMRNKVTDNDLKQIYDNCLFLIKKYIVTGQVKGCQKLMFHLHCIEKEREIVKMGINTFIYRDDVAYFTEELEKNQVCLLNLKDYERDIPDELAIVVSKTKNIFSNFYVLFTDYSNRVGKKIEAEKRAKDPILFATFEDEKTRTVIDRFYYIGDWVDEYCDLTLDKMVDKFNKGNREDVLKHIETPTSLESLEAQLNNMVKKDGNFRQVSSKPKKLKFKDRVRIAFKGI